MKHVQILHLEYVNIKIERMQYNTENFYGIKILRKTNLSDASKQKHFAKSNQFKIPSSQQEDEYAGALWSTEGYTGSY